MRLLTEKARVAVYEGRVFGPEGKGFVRFNGTCPRQYMLKGLERICSVF